jgi:hypothetical protein
MARLTDSNKKGFTVLILMTCRETCTFGRNLKPKKLVEEARSSGAAR